MTLGRIFSPSAKWGPSQHLPHRAMLKMTVGSTPSHPRNGSCLSLSSPCSANKRVVAFVYLVALTNVRPCAVLEGGAGSSPIALVPAIVTPGALGLATSWQGSDKGYPASFIAHLLCAGHRTHCFAGLIMCCSLTTTL